jgi:Protein of unknown function (DUF2550)
MLIALLIGVDLIVVVGLAVIVLGRRRWLKRQPGEFAGTIRVSRGAIEGLSPKWKRGFGRWVRDVLVWSKAPLMLSNELIPVESSRPRTARIWCGEAARRQARGDRIRL